MHIVHLIIRKQRTYLDNECTKMQNPPTKMLYTLNAYTSKLNNVWAFFPHQLTVEFVLELENLWSKLRR